MIDLKHHDARTAAQRHDRRRTRRCARRGRLRDYYDVDGVLHDRPSIAARARRVDVIQLRTKCLELASLGAGGLCTRARSSLRKNSASKTADHVDTSFSDRDGT